MLSSLVAGTTTSNTHYHITTFFVLPGPSSLPSDFALLLLVTLLFKYTLLHIKTVQSAGQQHHQNRWRFCVFCVAVVVDDDDDQVEAEYTAHVGNGQLHIATNFLLPLFLLFL